MTLQIALVLSILAAAIILFISERIRVDLVALMVLTSLVITNLVTPADALSGFSNLAVVTVWAVFVLSGGLFRTGVANAIGRVVLRLTGKSELRLVVVIMLVTSVLSSFMNDIGVAALFLPVVINIARTTGIPPSRLLMPLAFSALLGGLNTLIGTPPNILVSEALREAGLAPFEFFDYTPVGITLTLSGIIFMALIGRHLLPKRDISKEFGDANQADPGQVFDLQERLYMLSLPPGDSILTGKTLAESRIGSTLGLNILAILRAGQTQLAPRPDAVLQSGDQLIVSGRLERYAELRGRQHLVLEEQPAAVKDLTASGINIAELALPPNSDLLGKTLRQIDFRRKYGVVVRDLAGREPLRADVDSVPLQTGDVMLVQGLRAQLDDLQEKTEFLISTTAKADTYRLEERMFSVRIPAESTLVGRTIAESHLAESFEITILGIMRDGETNLMPSAQDELQENDLLLVKGEIEHLASLRGLEDITVERDVTPSLRDLESEQVGMVEAVLSPYSTLAGSTLEELRFREKFGLNVLALWREGRPQRSNLRDVPLRFGDALLLHGPRRMFSVLGREPGFLVLAEDEQEPPRLNKAPLAVGIMALVLSLVILEVLPIAIAAVGGVTLMILTGCLTMEEAYRYIEWKAVFLIAGMLPLGIAMERSGAAQFLAEGMVNLIGGFGPMAVLAGVYILAALASQVMPNPAVAVLLAPIALNTAENIGVSPYPLMMAVALSASAAFLSPVGHSANVLIMGPGGYRFIDYIKVGAPLTLVTLIVTLLVMPIFWPF